LRDGRESQSRRIVFRPVRTLGSFLKFRVEEPRSSSLDFFVVRRGSPNRFKTNRRMFMRNRVHRGCDVFPRSAHPRFANEFFRVPGRPVSGRHDGKTNRMS
jgi:hypothetical protein